MGYIRDFDDAYKTLENALRVATGITNQPIISLYIKILPPALSAQMDTIRKFRNDFPGHGTKVGGKSPKPPDTYVNFLNRQIAWVDSHRAEIRKKMCRHTSLKSNKSNSSSTSTNYGSTKQYAALSYEAELVRQAVATHKNQIDPQRRKLKRLVIKSISHWLPGDKMRLLSAYGCRRKLFQSLDDALADAILVNMKDYELDQLLSTLK